MATSQNRKKYRVQLTVEQANYLMQLAAGFELPSRVGDTVYDATQRRFAQFETYALLQALKRESYYARQHGGKYALLFGAEDDWEVQFDTETGAMQKLRLLETARVRTQTLELSDEEMSGAVWCLEMALSPAKKIEGGRKVGDVVLTELPTASPEEADRWIWPLAAALGKVAMIRKNLGLDEYKVRRLIDDEAEAPAVATEETGKLEKP